MSLLLGLTESNQQTQNKTGNAMKNDDSGEFEGDCCGRSASSSAVAGR